MHTHAFPSSRTRKGDLQRDSQPPKGERNCICAWFIHRKTCEKKESKASKQAKQSKASSLIYLLKFVDDIRFGTIQQLRGQDEGEVGKWSKNVCVCPSSEYNNCPCRRLGQKNGKVLSSYPPIDLYLISEKSIWKNQGSWTRFLVFFKFDFYCLCS